MLFSQSTLLLSALSFSLASALNPPDPTITAAPVVPRGLLDFLGKNCDIGIMLAEKTTSGCCVGGDQHLDLSTCPGWPICTGSATKSALSPVSCAEVIDINDDDYDSKSSSASESLKSSGTVYRTVVGSGSISGGGVTVTGNVAARPTGAAGAAALGALAGAAAMFL